MSTNRDELERRAGDQWDAAHDAKRPTRQPQQAAALQRLFDKIDALTKLKSFDLKKVAKVLGLRPKYEETQRNEYFVIYEAKLPDGVFRRVEVRVGSNAARGILIVDIDPALAITPGEVADRFGSAKAISNPTLHAPPDSPYYYLYPRPGGELRLGIKPGAVHTVVSVVWDTINSLAGKGG